MPSYNAGCYINESINSVLAQTYENWELLITDDASNDNSVEIIKRHCEKDSRISFIVSKQNQGISETRNLSIERAKGRFIAFLDNDDLWMPNKLEKQVKFMLENGYAFTYASYELIDNEGASMNKVILTQGVMDYSRYSRNTIIGCGTVMIDRNIVGDFQMPQNDTSDDMALWLSLMRKGFNAYPLNEVVLKYRITNNSASSKKLKAASDVWKVYRINESMSWLKAASCFVGYAFNAVKKRVI